MGQDFLTHMAAPGTARGALIGSVSKLKAEAKAPRGEAVWEGPGRGDQ